MENPIHDKPGWLLISVEMFFLGDDIVVGSRSGDDFYVIGDEGAMTYRIIIDVPDEAPAGTDDEVFDQVADLCSGMFVDRHGWDLIVSGEKIND